MRLVAALLGVFMVLGTVAVPSAQADAATPEVYVGSYTGGGGNRDVALPAGFGRPDAILVQASTPGAHDTAAWLRTDDMPVSHSKSLADAGDLEAGRVLSQGTDLFRVGSALNVPGISYGFVALAAGAGEADDYFAHGSYTGSGSRRTIGLDAPGPWRPDLVVIASDVAEHAVYHTGTMGDDRDFSMRLGTTTKRTNAIKSLSDGGFGVGTDRSVNKAGTDYYWFALRNLENTIEQSSYTGSGTELGVSLDEAFRPDYVFAQRLFGPGHHRLAHLPEFPSSSSQDVANAPSGGFDGTNAAAARYIQSFELGGFTVGKSLSIPTEHHYWALQSTPGTSTDLDVVSPKPFQVVQRSASNTAGIRVAGNYSGTPGAIEARWADGPWQTIDASPSGGDFSGLLTNAPAGTGRVEARIRNNGASTQTIAAVGVGDVYAVAGQSNAVGRGSTLQPAPTVGPDGSFAALFGNDDRWKLLSDPYDSSVDQVDLVSREVGRGSWVPELAEALLAGGDGVPVAFIPTAADGTSIQQWQRNLSASTLYGSLRRRVTEVGGGDTDNAVRAVLFLQGSRDVTLGTASSTYEAKLEQLASDVEADFGVPLVLGGQVDFARASGTAVDKVRVAQRNATHDHPNIFTGAQHFDIDLADNGGDGLHIGLARDPDGSAELSAAARRWWAALDAISDAATDGRGPHLASVILENPTSLVVSVTNDSGPLRADGPLTPDTWEVRDETGDLGVASATILDGGDSNKIRLGLARSVVGAASLSFARGHLGAGARVPTDSRMAATGDAVHSPLEPFADEPVTGDGGDPGPGNAAPNAAVTATPKSGTAPLDVAFDASASTDGDGAITAYRWDFDGNGSTDATTAGPETSHTYAAAGLYAAKVTVVDDDAAADTAPVAGGIRVLDAGGSGDFISVEFVSGNDYSNSGTATAGDIHVAKSAFGWISRVTGTATIAGTSAGDATFTINARTAVAFLPIYTGKISISDPGAGLATTAPLLLSSVSPHLGDGARGAVTWIRASGFSFEVYRLLWTVEQG